MERSGLMLCHELREAVVGMSTRTYGEDQTDFSLAHENRLRQLLGRPVISDNEYSGGPFVDHQTGQAIELPAAAGAPALQRRLYGTTTRVHVLAAEIEQAVEMAGGDDNRPVWTELSKLAETQYGAMIGFTSEGIQYRGDTHRATGEPDILTFKQLCDRLRNRRNKRDKAV
jgi:hypothetical protein